MHSSFKEHKPIEKKTTIKYFINQDRSLKYFFMFPELYNVTDTMNCKNRKSHIRFYQRRLI